MKEIVIPKGFDRWSRHGAQLLVELRHEGEIFGMRRNAGPQFRTPEIGDTPREVSQ